MLIKIAVFVHLVFADFPQVSYLGCLSNQSPFIHQPDRIPVPIPTSSRFPDLRSFPPKDFTSLPKLVCPHPLTFKYPSVITFQLMVNL